MVVAHFGLYILLSYFHYSVDGWIPDLFSQLWQLYRWNNTNHFRLGIII